MEKITNNNSKSEIEVNPNFRKWSKGFSGCWGGDAGLPERRSIWICGIEEGGEYNSKEEFIEELNRDVNSAPMGKKFDEYIEYINSAEAKYDKKVLKLINAFCGECIDKYKDKKYSEFPFIPFADDIKGRGFFKINLFPIAFPGVNYPWKSEKIDYEKITNLQNKDIYKEWCRKNRFPAIKCWIKKYNPKIVICFGKSPEFLADFKKVFLTDNSYSKGCIPLKEKTGEESKRNLIWFKNNSTGMVIVICPFPGWQAYCLNNDYWLQTAGNEIRNIL